MMPNNSLFIVLEGGDGAGKTTQFKLLAERLRAAGHDVDTYDFPRYNEPSSYFVQRYLNGEYGPASEVSPYTSSIFFALDRFEAAPLIRQSLADGKIVMANRYAGSNMAHQGGKFTKSGEQRGFFVWAESLEYQLFSIPRPTLNLFLRVPAEVAYELIKKKATRSYTDKSHDEHEADLEHLKQAVGAYDSLCQLFPKDFRAIDCTKNNKILPVAEINNRIWEILKPMLPEPKHAGHSTVVSLKGKPPEAEAETGAVETAPDKIEPKLNLAEIKDITLLAIISLLGNGLVAERSLKWPPGGLKPRLNYFIPAGLPPKLATKYRSTMDKLAENSRQIRQALPKSESSYSEYVVPLSALVSAKIDAELDTATLNLSESSAAPIEELRQITKKPRAELKEPQALSLIIKQITAANLSANSANLDDRVKLITASPRNELDLLADSLYQYSNLSREEIAAQVDSWSYEQKAQALKKLCKSRPQAILGKVSYRFDVLGSLVDLEMLSKKLKPLGIQIQPPTPRYGYEVPSAIEKAGIDELFIESFDLSLGLYSDMQAAGLDELAPYAVLLGHRQRWQLITNGEVLLAQTLSSALAKLLSQKVSEVHPLISLSIARAEITESPKSKKTAPLKKKRRNNQ